MAKFNYFSYKEKRFDKFSLNEQEDLIFDLINAFALMQSPADTALLLQDLLTEKEVRNLAKRLRIAKLILKGETNENIAREMHSSMATISKVRMWLENAGEGLRRVIKQLPKRQETYKPKKIPGIGYGLPQILLHYSSSYLTEKEKKRLAKFLEEMRAKSSMDREFREETSQEFKKNRTKKK
jgi:uncharacterized protein YerC